jgi:hypothetical protein
LSSGNVARSPALIMLNVSIFDSFTFDIRSAFLFGSAPSPVENQAFHL